MNMSIDDTSYTIPTDSRSPAQRYADAISSGQFMPDDEQAVQKQCL